MPPNCLPLLPLVLEDVPSGLRQALAQEGIPFCERHVDPMAGRFVLFDSRTGLKDSLLREQTAIDVDRLRAGAEIDPFEALVDERSGPFQWKIGGHTVTEDIALVDKRTIRRQVLSALRQRIEAVGGIWLRLSAFPFPYRSAMNFRIDYDQYERDDFDRLLDTIAGHEGATSHFINGSAYESADEALVRLRGLDVGSHGYWHHTYRTLDENLRNVRRGIELLRRAGIEPSGFVGPKGRFNRPLLEALETLGVGHASEFGLAYDELPFVVGRCVLQIPVHPISLGIFMDGLKQRGVEQPSSLDAVVEIVAEYFASLAEKRYRAGEPIFLYGHPTGRLGRYPEPLRRVLETTADWTALWRTTISQFARWWQARDRIQWKVVEHEGYYTVHADRLPTEYRVGIEYHRSQHVALMPMDQTRIRFSPTALAYENRQSTLSVRPVRLDQAEGLRGHVKKWIDWERTTPIDQIGRRTWQNWAKRALRYCWKHESR